MNGIFKIIRSLEDLNVLSDGITETVILETKKQEGGFLSALLAPLAASWMEPVISTLVKVVIVRGVGRVGRGYMNKKF